MLKKMCVKFVTMFEKLKIHANFKKTCVKFLTKI